MFAADPHASAPKQGGSDSTEKTSLSAASDALMIREGTPADAALLARLHATSWQVTYKGIMPSDFLASRVFAEREAHWHEKMKTWDPAHGEIRIAVRNGEAIGFMTVVDDCEPQHGVYLDHLHVLPGHKGSGAGKQLIAIAEQWARARDAKQMHLLAWEANLPARGFYEHLGWYCAEKFEDTLAEARAIACRYVLKLLPV
jgi:GNAT superfamily N-acetyltransferase